MGWGRWAGAAGVTVLRVRTASRVACGSRGRGGRVRRNRVCFRSRLAIRFIHRRHAPPPDAPVAQWIEYCPPKAGVAGSIPAGRAKSDKPLSDFLLSSSSSVRKLYGNSRMDRVGLSTSSIIGIAKTAYAQRGSRRLMARRRALNQSSAFLGLPGLARGNS